MSRRRKANAGLRGTRNRIIVEDRTGAADDLDHLYCAFYVDSMALRRADPQTFARVAKLVAAFAANTCGAQLDPEDVWAARMAAIDDDSTPRGVS